MNFEDFVHNFTKLFICTIYPENEKHVVRGEWNADSAGGTLHL